MQNKPVERPGFRPIGTPVEELDTPALVLDLATAEHNIRTVHSFFEGRVAKIRPHIKTHNCPAIGWLQLTSDGTAGGICTAKVGQAEVFAQNGFNDILIANEIVTRNKIDRLCALARRCSVTVAVDNPDHVKDLSQASMAGEWPSGYPDVFGAVEDEAREYLGVKGEELRSQGITKVESQVALGDAAGQIADLAHRDGESLVVMTSRGRSGLSRALLGSIADRVVRSCEAPVLLVRA